MNRHHYFQLRQARVSGQSQRQHGRRRLAASHLALIVVGVLALLAAPGNHWRARAATNWFVSPTGNDNNLGTSTQPFQTISRAYAAASAGDTIFVNDGIYTSTAFPKNFITIDKDVTIMGLGNFVIFNIGGWRSTPGGPIDGNPPLPLFTIAQGRKVTINNITINGGPSTYDGIPQASGIHILSGATVTLDRVTLRNANPQSTTGQTTRGGSIYNAGTLTITNSFFQNDHADEGGGIYNAGTLTVGNNTFDNSSIANVGTLTLQNSTIKNQQAPFPALTNAGLATVMNSTFQDNLATALTNASGGTMKLTNCTLSGNSASQFGGGVFNAGTMEINFCTLANNSASTMGGGIFNSSTGTLKIKNSIVANSPAGGNCANESGGTFIALGKNFDTDGTGAALDSDFMQVSAAQLNLSGLGGNGGVTNTIALGTGSVAINAAPDCVEADGIIPVNQDQRGQFRCLCDVGAFEVAPPVANTPPTITTFNVTRRQEPPAATTDLMGHPTTTNIEHIATIADAQNAVEALTLTVPPTNNGITLSEITVQPDGKVMARVQPSCSATDASFNLQVTDTCGTTMSATLHVTVTLNTAPVLGYATPPSVSYGGSLTVTPNSGPSDNGQVSNIQVWNKGAYAGNIAVDATGKVTLSNATPPGTFLITIRATDNCGAIKDATFALTVNCPSTTTLTPSTLVAGQVGAIYSQTIAPSGGTAPFTFNVTGLPNGLSANATANNVTLGGRPLQAGRFNVGVTVTDAYGCPCASANYTLNLGVPGDVRFSSDYDGDGKADLAIWRPATATFWVYASTTGSTITKQLGASTDIPVPGDFDGDGKTDFAVFRPATGVWTIFQSSNGATVTGQWGTLGDVPVPGDFDGDHKTDLAIWRPATGNWMIFKSSGGTITTQWGTMGDVPVLGDYDGDGQTDLAMWRAATATFWIYNSATGTTTSKQWGAATDVPVMGDFDGDHKTDIAVWRPTTGAWLIFQSSNGQSPNWQWGVSSDAPVVGDFDGDGKSDLTVWRPSTGVWWIYKSTGGTLSPQWGTAGDLPVR